MIIENTRAFSHRLSIDGVIVNFDPTEVKEEISFRYLTHIKLDVDCTAEPVASRQVEFDVVGDLGEAFLPFDAIHELHIDILIISWVFHFPWL